jgi:hypothetical protein
MCVFSVRGNAFHALSPGCGFRHFFFFSNISRDVHASRVYCCLLGTIEHFSYVNMQISVDVGFVAFFLFSLRQRYRAEQKNNLLFFLII